MREERLFRKSTAAALTAGFYLVLALAVVACGDDDPDPAEETGKLLYVANSGDNTVTVISTETNTVVDTLELPAPARALYLHPFRSSFYVLLPSQDRVLKLLQRNSQELASIPIAGNAPYDLAFSDAVSGPLAYVTVRDSDRVSVLRLAEDRVLENIPVGDRPTDIAFDPGTGRMYVVNEGSATVSVIDLQNNAVIQTIPLGGRPGTIAFPSLTRAFVSDQEANRLRAINLSTLELDPNDPNIMTGAEPFGLAMRPTTNEMLVTQRGNNSVLVVDTAATTMRSTLVTGAGPTQVLVSADGKRAYVANTEGNSVTVLNLETKQPVVTIPVGAAPSGMTFY